MNRRAVATLVVPPVGCAVLAVLAVVHEGAFRSIVREDSVLEWSEVGAYAIAAVTAARIAWRARGVVRSAYAGLACVSAIAIGEELSWGQRVVHLTTPERVAAANRQHELNLHNLVGAESKTRLVLLAAALYGMLAPLVLRPGPFVPPRLLVAAFAVPVVYFSVRFTLLPEPTYVQAKFSEWPELCFAAAVALACRNALTQVRQGHVPIERSPSARTSAAA